MNIILKNRSYDYRMYLIELLLLYVISFPKSNKFQNVNFFSMLIKNSSISIHSYQNNIIHTHEIYIINLYMINNYNCILFIGSVNPLILLRKQNSLWM
jgi:hypothetical protein